ncbi:hypothetical protein, partial [Niastella koreensis]
FGMISREALPNSGVAYKFGFNGQLMNNDVKGGLGNSYTAQFWEYDSRIGRRWNLDPSPSIGTSQYSAFMNNPIRLIDPLGDTAIVGSATDDNVKVGNTEYKKEDLVNKFIQDWSKISGLNLSVNKETGQIQNNGVVTNKGISMKARKEILDLLSFSDNILIDFSSSSSQTLVDGGALDNKIVVLNPGEVEANIKGTSVGMNNKTFGYGMMGLHELWHTTFHNSMSHSQETVSTYGVIDASDKFGNEIRAELTKATGTQWGQRLSYAVPFVNGKSYHPLTSQAKTALKPVFDQMIKVLQAKQLWISSGYNPQYYPEFQKELKTLNSMKLPTAGVVAPQMLPGTTPPY